MRFSTVFSFALVAAVVAPVLSVPVAAPGPGSEASEHHAHAYQPHTVDGDLRIALKRALAAYIDEPGHGRPEDAARPHGGNAHNDKHHGDNDDDDKHHARALFGLLERSSPSPSPEPKYFCYMMSANNGKGCDTAQCKSGGGSCDLNPSTNRCNMNNMRGKSAPFACLGCKCSLEKS